jgi:hypothetical protein
MTLKEDSYSWRSHALIKRDFKHDHSELPVTYRSHKNTRLWCKGKVGVRHHALWHKEVWLFDTTTHVGKCLGCGKHMYREELPVSSVVVKSA